LELIAPQGRDLVNCLGQPKRDLRVSQSKKTKKKVEAKSTKKTGVRGRYLKGKKRQKKSWEKKRGSEKKKKISEGKKGGRGRTDGREKRKKQISNGREMLVSWELRGFRRGKPQKERERSDKRPHGGGRRFARARERGGSMAFLKGGGVKKKDLRIPEERGNRSQKEGLSKAQPKKRAAGKKRCLARR